MLRVFSGRPSESAALLADEEGFIRLRTGKYNKPGDVIVNWGNVGPIPHHHQGLRILNKQEAVERGRNKLKTFQVLDDHGVDCLPWTTNWYIAKMWLEKGHTVVVRKTLTGSEGAGILIVEKVNELIQAPLYTMYINKVREFRVHATATGIIDTQWKVHDPKLGPPKSWKVRSYANGFIFQRKGVNPNAQRDALAIQAVKALGLDFGGLDIIEDNQGNFYVVEVNTAPGIEGQTVTRYGEALRAYVAGKQYHPVPHPQQHPAAPAPVYHGYAPNPNNHGAVPEPAGPGLWANHPQQGGVRNLNLGWAV